MRCALLLALLASGALSAAAGAQDNRFASADSLVTKGDSAGALRLLDAAVRANASDGEAWHRRGVLAWNMSGAEKRTGFMKRTANEALLALADSSLRLATLYAPGTPGYAAAARWYGSGLTSPHAGTAAAPVNSGKTGNGLMAQLPRALVSCVSLEFGTYPGSRVLAAIAGDGWLHAYGELNSPKGEALKKEIRAAFYPDQDDWKELIAARSAEILGLALKGLAGG